MEGGRGKEERKNEKNGECTDTGRASYRAAQTNKLELTLELEGAKTRDDETTGDRRGEGEGGARSEREKRRIQDKVSSLRNDTSGLYSGNAG